MNLYWMLTCDRCMVCVSIALQNFLQKKQNQYMWLAPGCTALLEESHNEISEFNVT